MNNQAAKARVFKLIALTIVMLTCYTCQGQRAQASFLLSDSTIGAEPSCQFYIFPGNPDALEETSYTLSFPAHLGFTYLSETPADCYEMPTILQQSNYNDRNPICKFHTTTEGQVVLTVTNLRTTGDIQPSEYGLYFTGLVNGDSARQSQVGFDTSTGAYATTYQGTSAYETINTNYFDFNFIVKTSDVSLTGNPRQNGIPGELILNWQVGYAIPVDGTMTIGLPLQHVQYTGLGPTPSRSMVIDRGVGSIEEIVAPTNNEVEIEPASSAVKAAGYYVVSQESNPDPLLVQSSKDVTTNLQSINVTVDYDTSATKTYVKLQLKNQYRILAGSTLSLTIQTVVMPPSLSPLGGFIIYTGDSEFFEIEKAFYPKLTNKLPGNEKTTSQESKAEIVTGNGILQEGSTYLFTVQTTGDLPAGAYFTLKVPESVGIPENPATSVRIECIQGCDTSFLTVAFDPLARTGTFYGVIPEVSSYLPAPGPVQFSVSGFINPATTDKAYFVWTSYAVLAVDDYMIDQVSSMYVQAEQGSCSVSQLEPTDGNYQIYGIASSWTVTMQCTHGLSQSYGVEIVMPKDFVVISSQKCTVGNQNSNYTCLADRQAGTITAVGFLTSNIPENTDFTFTVDSIRNPAVGNIIYEIGVKTIHQGQGATIDQGSFTMTADKITGGKVLQFTVNPQNYGVGQYPVFYDFLVQPSGDLYQGSYLVITLPDDIQLYQKQILEQQCSFNMTGFTNSQIICKVSGNLITITGGFPDRGTDTMTAETLELIVPPILKFTLPEFWNPRTMQYSGAFGLSIFASDNQEIYTWSQSERLTVNAIPATDLSAAPVVQMNRAATPRSITIARDSYQNGITTNYNFTVVPTNFMSNGDKIVLVFPYPIKLSENSTCLGALVNLSPNQTASVSVDLTSIQITLSVADAKAAVTGRRLQSAKIASNEPFTLSITGVKNPSSTASTSQSIIYSAYTQTTLIEQQDSGLKIKNLIPGSFVDLSASIVPFEFISEKVTNYTLKFEPTNYQQDMTIVIRVPLQVQFEIGLPLRCIGLQGTDSPSLTCETNTITGEITIRDAVTYQPVNPGLIKIAFDSLKNPAQGVVTESFRLSTFTKEGFALDEKKDGLTINFFCEYPCQTCDAIFKSQCSSCYGGDLNQNWYNFTCITECPISFTNTTRNNCTECASPCATCTDTPQTCLSCIDGYRLENDKCLEIVYWPFPWILLAILWFIVIVCSECKTKGESRLKETFIAMLSFSEFGSWCTFLVFCYFRTGFGYATIGALGATSIYLALNLAHAVIHSIKIVPSSPQNYKTIVQKYKCSTLLVRGLSYLFSFKFSLLLVSWFCVTPRFKGDYSPQNMTHFNIISLIFIILPYPLMILTCCYYLYTDTFWSYAGWVSVEVIAVSTLMSSLMLVDAVSVLSCANKKAKIEAAPGSGGSAQKQSKRQAKVFAAAVDVDYESEDQDASKKMLKKRRGKGVEVDEFGEMEDDSHSRINPYTTNNSVSLDEHDKKNIQALGDYVKQMQEDKQLSDKDRIDMMSGQKEQLEKLQRIIEERADVQNLMSSGLDNDEVFRYVDEKIGHNDDLNKQILREIYEEQLQHMKIQSKKGYRDIEGEMEKGGPVSLRSEYDERVKEAAQLPLPVTGLIDEDEEVFKTKEGTKENQVQFVQQVTPRIADQSAITDPASIEDEGQLQIHENRSPVFELYDQTEDGRNELREDFMMPMSASYNSIEMSSLQGESVMQLQRSDAQMEINSSREEHDGIHIEEEYFQNTSAAFGDAYSEKMQRSENQSEMHAVAQNPYFDQVVTQRSKEGSEKNYIAKEQSNVRLSNKDFSLYGLQGRELPKDEGDTQRLKEREEQDGSERLRQREEDGPASRERERLEEDRDDGNIKMTASIATINRSPESKKFDESQTIGLKLVDLGLGNEFDGKKGREKGAVQKKAIEWFLQKESERQANASPQPSIRNQSKSPENRKTDDLAQDSKDLASSRSKDLASSRVEKPKADTLSPSRSNQKDTLSPSRSNLKDTLSDPRSNRNDTLSPPRSNRNVKVNSVQKQSPLQTKQHEQSPPRQIKSPYQPKVTRNSAVTIQDEYGHSESSEGIVNHELFSAQHYRHLGEIPESNGELITKLVKFDAPPLLESQTSKNQFLSQKNLLSTVSLSGSPITQKHGLIPQNLQPKQVTQQFQPASMLINNAKPPKQILYSDRSESSIEALMDDTPSNYNIPNGRLDGKSLGIKAMQLQQQNQKQRSQQALPNFISRQSELVVNNQPNKGLTSNYSLDGGWGNVNQPFDKRVQIIGEETNSQDEHYQLQNTYVSETSIKPRKKVVKTNKTFTENTSQKPTAYMSQSQIKSNTIVQKNNYV